MRRYVMVGEGTHALMVERHRLELFRSVQEFLSENGAPGLTDASK
jgi:hypothetical protein